MKFCLFFIKMTFIGRTNLKNIIMKVLSKFATEISRLLHVSFCDVYKSIDMMYNLFVL